jgi:hypothetical protein
VPDWRAVRILVPFAIGFTFLITVSGIAIRFCQLGPL